MSDQHKTTPERREYFSRQDIEELMRREMPVYMPAARVEWQGDGSAVVVWTEDQEKPENA